MSATPPRILAHQRALNSLARLHYDEMADLYAAERLRLGLPAEANRGRHGTVSKSRRCKCSRCREAHNAECRDRRARGLADDDARHGTVTGYRNHGCRCDRCREANNAYQREYQRRRKEAA